MIIAVAYDNGNIGEHFGHATCFALYNYTGSTVDECEKSLIDVSDLHGHKEMADCMREHGVDAVMSQSMGGEAKAQLLAYGIVPVAGYQGDADVAADMLVTGQLPIMEDGGSCSGGCGGCGGGCHHDEGESECGCGGGCGCH